VKSERSHYRDVCQKSAETVERLFETEIPQPGANISPKTNKGCIHYSFDMAQQVFTTISNSTILLLHRFTILMTLCSLDPSISWHKEMCYIWGLLWGYTASSEGHATSSMYFVSVSW